MLSLLFLAQRIATTEGDGSVIRFPVEGGAPGVVVCTAAQGFNVTEPSITLLPGRKYDVALAVQATPPGTTVEVMGGHWTVVSNVLHEYAPSARCTYSGEPLGRFVAGAAGELPGSWGHLTTTVAVPEATAMTNGTALQLRITPPESERGLGATVWLEKVSVREAE